MNFEIKVNDKLSLKLRHAEDAEATNLVTYKFVNFYAIFTHKNRNREQLRQWLPWVDATLTAEDTKKYLEGELENFKNKKTADFGVWYENAWVGSMGFNQIDLINEWAEIGYWLDKDYEGKGIMTECVKAMINYGFNDLNLNRIQIRCSNLNLRSKAIPERLGFVLEGTLRQDHKRNGEFSDSLTFGLLKKEWKNN